MPPRHLTQGQKDNQKKLLTSCNESQNNRMCLKMSPHDETWIFQYDPEMKRKLTHQMTPTSPRIKKT
jgi:hypothetical protein